MDFQTAYKRVPETQKDFLRALYITLCHDESPLVRRGAVTNLVDFLNVLELECIKNEFVAEFESMSKDDQVSFDNEAVTSLYFHLGLIVTCFWKPYQVTKLTSLNDE